MGTVFALTRGNNEAEPGTGGGTGGGGGGTAPTSAPAADTPSGAVKTFLDALAAGNAEAALSVASNQPDDKTFLTSEALKASLAKAPITAINVPEVTDKYAYSVNAQYKIGDELVTADYNVEKFGDQWKVKQVWNEVRRSSSYDSLPLLINGTAAKGETVNLFPGSYAISTGSEYVSWGVSNLVVKDPEGYVSMSGMSPKLTSDGTNAFKSAVKSAVDSCLKEEKSTNSCGLSINPPSGAKADTKSIKWSLSYGSVTKMTPRLDYEDPKTANAYLSVGYKAKYTGTYKGKKTNFSSSSTQFLDKPQVNLFTKPLKVSWEK